MINNLQLSKKSEAEFTYLYPFFWLLKYRFRLKIKGLSALLDILGLCYLLTYHAAKLSTTFTIKIIEIVRLAKRCNKFLFKSILTFFWANRLKYLTLQFAFRKKNIAEKKYLQGKKICVSRC